MNHEPTPAKVQLTDGLGQAAEARWYCVSRDGMATLCVDELDACYTAEQSDKNWQASSPHRAVRLVDAAEVDRLKAAADAVLREAKFYGACYGATPSCKKAIETLAQVLRPNV